MTSSLVVMAAAAFLQQAPCDALKTISLPRVAITAAEIVAAGTPAPGRGGRGGRGGPAAPLPAHCRVAATLRPSADSHIEMELWLPIDRWNGKFLAVGNGGWAGSISFDAMASGLRRGYATASNDTGHKGASAVFALGHPEKLIDFGYRAMHEMAVQSKALIEAFYRRAPDLSYYQGCSTGGRQGMMAAQRFPEDFDAIIAGAPVHNMVHLNVSQVAQQVDMLKNPSRLVPPGKRTRLANAVVAACDERDGVKDGIISEPRACRFDPAVLACEPADPSSARGASPSECLTGAQVENVRTIYAPVTTMNGAVVYPGRSPGFESGWRIPTPGAPLNPLFTDMPRYIGRQDPHWDPMTFNLETDLALALKHGGFIEASDPNLAKFKARGGKLLLYHGWADPGPAPENTINYYEAVNRTLGGKEDDWMRLFLMPGVGHCGGGVGPDQADFLGAIERWREQGVAPDHIIATRPPARDGGLATPMSRPLCPHPQVARYNGSGSTDDAKNFVCAAPQSAPPRGAAMSVQPAQRPTPTAIAARKPGEQFKDCRNCPEMVVVPAGSFMMGSPPDEPERRDNERHHQVTIPRPFAIGKTEVTWDQWEACVRDRWCDGPGVEDSLRTNEDGTPNKAFVDWGRGARPVVGVSWFDAQNFVGWLNWKAGEDDSYRLPSEAEWEYAARAGTTMPYPWGTKLDHNYGNFGIPGPGLGGKAEGRDVWVDRTAPVASFPPNGFGLHDMHGNVFEWVEDCYEADRAHAPANGSANKEGNCANRVFRDGTFLSNPYMQRSARRGAPYPATRRGRNYLGFRVAKTLD